MNEAWLVLLPLAAIVLLTCGLLVLAWTHGRLGVVAAVVFVVALLAWVVDFAAVTSGYRDADGFVDCGDSCTTTHRLAALGFVGPPLLISVGAAGMTVALLARARRRRLSQ
jgi:hypothetical protein